MKILNLLTNEKTETEEKLASLQGFVAKVRAKYGNTDKEIEAVKIPTTNGHVPISLLTGDEKTVVAEGEIREIIAMTTAVVENTDGAMFDRVFEGFVAVNPILTNLDQETDSDY